jgi:transposase
MAIAHQQLHHGERCPACGKGNVYNQKEPKVLVRVVGQAPLAATVYSLERLRCNGCGQVFMAQEHIGNVFARMLSSGEYSAIFHAWIDCGRGWVTI